MARANCPRCSSRATASQLRDEDGFVGDQASQTAFRALLERWRQRAAQAHGKDPLGDAPFAETSARSTLDAALQPGKATEAGDLVHGAIEEFAMELASVIQRFLRQPSWSRVSSAS